MAKRKLTVWMSDGSEYALSDLARRMKSHPEYVEYKVECAEELLARLGYRFNEKQLLRQLAKFNSAYEKYNATRDTIFAGIEIERVGLPHGKVCLPHVEEWLRQNPGKAYVEEFRDDPPLEPRSRH